MQPLISIITPTYNRAYILGKAIESIRSQTYQNWELIIVDDGSTDNTKELVFSYNDPRIIYVYQKNQKQIAARNNALTLAKGEWITYVDSDNTLRPECLATIVAWISQHPKTLWGFPKGTRIQELYDNGILIRTIDDTKDFPEEVHVQDIFHRKLHTDTTGAFHHRSIIEKGIRWDEHVGKMEDWEFFMQLGTLYPDNFLYIPVLLYDYHQRYGGDGVVSNSSYRDWAKIFEYIYQKHKNDPLMAGQTWYPDRVNKWNKLADAFDKGSLPPYHLYYFQDK